jgi:hypothetical protein
MVMILRGYKEQFLILKKLILQLAEAFKENQQEQYELFARKMMDYGLSNISLGSTLEDPDDITSFIDWYLAAL